MIQLENVHKSYGQTKVLKGIDLQIQDQDATLRCCPPVQPMAMVKTDLPSFW